MLRRLLTLAAVIGLICIAQPAQAQDRDKTLRLSGSTTVLPIAQKAAEVYMNLYPDLRLSVSGTGSGDGLKAIVEGSTDIANSSRDLKAKETKLAGEKGITLVRHAVALDCVSVIVNPANPVQNLTLAQLRAIYNGEYKSWRDLGGEDKPIVAVNRDVSSGTFEVWLEKVLQGDRVRPDAQVQASNGGVSQAVAGNKFAIGYVGLGYLTGQVKAVTVDGVAPNVADVRNKTYPLARELYMFTRQGGSRLADDFIAFLTSPDGQKLVEQEGFVPLQ